jgi:ATP-dependent helicase/nuclease subunit A
VSPRPSPQTPRLPFDADAPATPELPDAADRAAAVDPRRNVVLEASAGTGKTRVLVDRYINLLKAGVDPRNILAMTFTRKAAAEMRERIVRQLREAGDRGEIDTARWRELRERLGEVAISTIDAFCLSLLREFPLEADLDPGFAMADETEVLRFIDEALDRTLRECRGMAQRDAAVGLVFAQLPDARLRAGLAVLLERRLVAREALRRFLVSGPADMTPAVACARAAGRVLDALEGVDGGLARFLAEGPVHHPRYALLVRDIDELRSLVPASADGGDEVGSRRLAERFRAILETIEEHFFTRERQPRARWSYKPADCPSSGGWSRHRHAAVALAPRLAGEIARFRRDLNVVLSHGVWRVFETALREYRRTLQAHAVVDFPEALWRTLVLLEQMDEFAHSRYLLEGRFHHLLVDEFQDTSQAQWELVSRLVRAWGEGVGIAQDLPLTPSIFVVGDRKQSIYGFRDADAGVLARAAREIARLRTDGDVRRSIRKSFRAVPGLLAFTNDLFAAVEKVEGRDDAFVYGETDTFPLSEGAGVEPVVGVIAAAQGAACAERVAAEVAALLERGSVRDRQTGLARRAQPGDVGILFRSREGHQAFEAALERRGIPVYVYKGLGFFDAAEIKDVVALLRYLASPASDLRAAAFLRSRFVRLSDRGLQALAPRLAGALLAPVAAEADLEAEDRAVLACARQGVAAWLPLVDWVPPAELVDRILRDAAYVFELHGARTGQALENLKKMRAVIRRIQNRGYATVGRIAGHLDRLSAGDESNAVIDAVGSVHLMTVHAAKGLEFPVVFVVNMGKATGGWRAPIRLSADPSSEAPSVAVGDYESEADEDAAAREREETKRLLYVAVTRARDRLYLSAVVPGDTCKPGRGSLAEVLPQSFLGVFTEAAAGRRERLTWSGPSGVHPVRVCLEAAEPQPVGPAPRESSGHASDYGPLADDGSVARVPATGLEFDGPRARPSRALQPGGTGRLVGTVVHRLFEQLDHAAADDEHRRLARAEGLVPAGDLSPDDRVAVAREAAASFTAVLEREGVVRTLVPAGMRLHEVPFSLRRGDTIVHGTVDSLVCLSDGVLVLEFKTGAPAPSHHRQVEVYLEAARGLFPGQDVRGVLVYPEQDVWVDGR